ncbi:SDR family NAD(P)-dependent oxidoreductase [Pandoraea anhela]|uniref:Short-chain dehydrogenase/reductase n=1 Tax=Pandoraea anhela TaxID=2508295 RepID=A0A5E4X873_9BURK|nr:SDR family NAD(P)-dependent oxidoreductase [Pandoraea anhela]VVE32438.1 short-chain dehydrogenase/reductase [Pandoraea anhela]
MTKPTWFITGAAGGLGLTLAEKVLSEGHHVIAAVRRVESLQALQQAWPDQLQVESVDVTDPDRVRDVAARYPGVDIVVNNAGGAVIGAMEEMTEAQIAQQITLNLLAPIHVTRAFLGTMRARRHGTFIHITSVGGRATFPCCALYHAAKFGLEGFAEAVSQETAEFGIKTILIEPGSIRTNFVANIQWTTEIDDYRTGAVANLRNLVKTRGDEVASGDPARMADAIYAVSQMAEPPLRTVLGADAYEVLESTYARSLAELKAQKNLATSVSIEGRVGFHQQ